MGVACSLLFKGNIFAYDPASNGAEWILVLGTVTDLYPVEDSSAQELSNITLLDSPEDIPQMDQFGECHRGPTPVLPAAASSTRAALHDKEEVMEQEPTEEEREYGEYTEEVNTPVPSRWNSTDSDRHTEVADSLVPSLQNSTDSVRHTEEEDSPESSLQNSADSDRQTEEEDEGELSDEPTGEPTDRPTDETAVKLTEGCPQDDELTEEHLPGDELTEGHPPDYEPMGTITVECPTLGWELPPGDAWEEDRVVIHASEDEMDHLC